MTVEIIAAVLIVFLCFMGWRNYKVFQLRETTNLQIYMLNARDIKDRIYGTAQTRRAAYNKVSYNAMFYKFWKPVKLDSFFNDTWFVKETSK